MKNMNSTKRDAIICMWIQSICLVHPIHQTHAESVRVLVQDLETLFAYADDHAMGFVKSGALSDARYMLKSRDIFYTPSGDRVLQSPADP